MARVALVCNLIHPEYLRSGPLDAVAELDSEETLLAVESALRGDGHDVVRVEADSSLAISLAAAGVDIVFNIAERISDVPVSASRESLVPALCEILGLRYTGSGVLCTALCLDKPLTKQLLTSAGIATPRFQVIAATDESLMSLRYPLIVKLAREGSSMGLSAASVVDDEAAVRAEIQRLLTTYRGPLLIEEFIEGREFTVGLLGNAELEVLPIVEVVFTRPRGINLFELDDSVRAMALVAGRTVPAVVDEHYSVCPAVIDETLAARIRDTARRAFHLLGCRDWCRIDLRLGEDGTLHVLELNPIAGIDPSYLLPRAAAVGGYAYVALVKRILDLALARG
ncbi:MAG: ATP-grasp domain-containing protein [Gammaproteobacteria bacterium]|nr:ATP-grasp domain-containing protein [Gammaproteobacteria bacterium]